MLIGLLFLEEMLIGLLFLEEMLIGIGLLLCDACVNFRAVLVGFTLGS
jgi:hypothetical protein